MSWFFHEISPPRMGAESQAGALQHAKQPYFQYRHATLDGQSPRHRPTETHRSRLARRPQRRDGQKAPSYEVVVGHWTTCQNDSFAWQLDHGARAFDLRLGYLPGSPKGTYYFHHNGYRSHRVLDELIDAVHGVLDRNPDEFIILDFHQLRDGDNAFDFRQFSDLLKQRLGQRAISPRTRKRPSANSKPRAAKNVSCWPPAARWSWTWTSSGTAFPTAGAAVG